MRLKPELYDVFEKRINIEECKQDYIDFGGDFCKEKYKVSEGNIRTFAKKYDLIKIRKQLGQEKKRNTWAEKEKLKNDNLFSTITKETILKYYEDENHNWKECLEYFNISNATFVKLLTHYNIHKSAKAHNDQIKKTKLEKYGNENYNNRELATITYKDKTGYDNPRKNPEVIKKITTKASKTILEKYGVPYYCLTDDCIKSLKIKDSKPNLDFKQLLIKNNINILDDNVEFTIQNRNYDFKIDNYLIEINPFATHNSTWGIHGKALPKDYHFNKTKLAIDNGYRCINIWDWDDSQKIINVFLNEKEKVQARKCEIKEITQKESKEFINKYHIQNYAKAKINIGLFYKEELISIMTFSKPRYNKNYEYELIRYCSNKSIIGGVEKLFKYFIEKYSPNSIISYCDNSKFIGDTYLKLNFKLKTFGRPSKHWYNHKIKMHITDNLLRQRGFDQLFGTSYGKGTSNRELMLEHGFVEIYDAGQSVYEWYKETI